jgi:hypothetical protein
MLGFKKETLKKNYHFQPTKMQLHVANYHLQLYWCRNFDLGLATKARANNEAWE